MIRNSINKFKNIKFEIYLEKVKQCQIVIYDEEASEKLKVYFYLKFFCFRNKAKKINIPILIKSILKDNFKWKTHLF